MSKLPLVALLALGLAAPAARADAPQPLSFAQAVGLATGQAPAVELADLRTREAGARVTQARSSLLPGLSGSASAVNRTFSLSATGISFPSGPGFPAFPELLGPVNVLDARVKATQTLFDYASWVRVREAGQGLRLSRAEKGATAEGTAQAAALAYLRAARAQAVADARAADADLAAQLAELAVEQEKAGVSAHIDVVRAQTQVAATRGALLVARNGLDRAQIDLARALGADPGTRFALRDTLSADLGASDTPADTAAALAMARARRPELAAETLRRDRARSERTALAAERLPRLDASADYGLSGARGPEAVPTRTFAVALTLPFLDGFRREGRMAEQGEVARESEVRLRDLDQQIESEIGGAVLDIGSGREQMAVAADRLRLAAEELSQARERFREGVAGNIEVIDAQSSLLRARDADIDARFAVASARVNLARAAGAALSLH